MRSTFDIFITAGGHARYVETVEHLGPARKRLKLLASKSSIASCIQCRAASWNSLSAQSCRSDCKKPARLTLFGGASRVSTAGWV